MNLLSEKSLREALPRLDLLPEPVLWIDKGYEVLWNNECARRLYDADSPFCYSRFHGLDRPCNEVGEPCPKGQAKSLEISSGVVDPNSDDCARPLRIRKPVGCRSAPTPRPKTPSRGKPIPYSAIKQFRILPQDFSIESGELTPTLKVKRKVVTERYQAEIDALYPE